MVVNQDETRQRYAELMGGRLPITRPTNLRTAGGKQIPHPEVPVYGTAVPIGNMGDQRLFRDHHLPTDCGLKSQELNNQQVGIAIQGLKSTIRVTSTIKLDEVPIYTVKLVEITKRTLTDLMAALCFPAFIKTKPENDTYRIQVASLYFSIFSSLGCELNHNTIQDILQVYALKPKFVTCDSQQDLFAALKKYYPEFLNYWDKIRPDILRHDKGYDLTAILACTSLLFMSKVYNPAGYKGYLANRYRAFSNSIGRGELMNSAIAVDMPSEGIKLINAVMTSSHSIRRVIFQCMVAISQESKGWGNIRLLMKRALELLAWSEMTHITMIDTCLLGMFPEVLCHSVFRAQIPALVKALEYLNSLALEDRPIAKILYPQEQTGVLNRRHLNFWADLALEIFKKTSQSAAYFATSADKNTLGVNSAVMKYIDMRTQNLGLNIACSSLSRRGHQLYGF